MKNIIYMGTPEFAVPALQALLDNEAYKVIAVVTQPDRKVGRKRVLTPPPVKAKAVEYDVPVYQPEKISESKELEDLLTLDADLIITAAYGQFLPKVLLDHPKFGSINIHASLLPKYRGAAPIHYAVMNGDEETGVTIMYMDDAMDAGDILSQKTLTIEEADDTGALFEKLSFVGRDLLLETLPDLFENNITSKAQDQTQVSYSPMITREQEQLDWTKSALDIHNHVRGLRPFPGTYTLLDGQRFKIWQTELIDGKTNKSPGTVAYSGKKELYVAAGDGGLVSLTTVQPSGKGKLDIEQFQSGNRLEEGTKFGE